MDFGRFLRWHVLRKGPESPPSTLHSEVLSFFQPRRRLIGGQSADGGQGVRIRRHVMGAFASLAVLAVVYLYAAVGFVEYRVANVFAALVILCVFTFTVCFASGLNRRFGDPSLTVAQMTASGLTLAYLAYASGPFRALQLPLYMIALLFGAFRLTTRQQLAISVFFTATYALALALAGALDVHGQPGAGLPGGAVLVAHLMLVLLPMALIGGYVQSYRKRLSVANHELHAALEKIERIATFDELTGLYSRRVITEIAAKEQKRSDRRGSGLCIAMVDADHFKRFNDLYGHPGGDRVLRMVSETLLRTLRATEHVGRYGGEEFMVVLPETTREHATIPLERLRKEVSSTPIEGIPPQERVTVSIGVAEYRRGEDLHATVGRADAALYEAKRSGRDRVVWSKD